VERVEVRRGSVTRTAATAGSVEPQNRLEVKPSIGGRVEDILVREGSRVRKGQVLALMSSTERAALLDAAAARGREEVARWEAVYKPTSLVSPIDGEVIVRAVEPGQTVSAGSAVLVISDRLIVSARVDEVDAGAVATGQTAVVTLVAYPDVKTTGVVDHISYESKIVNNVVTYDAEIVLASIPDVFRSGMSADVSIITGEHDGVIVLPLDAVAQDGARASVTVVGNGGKEETRSVRLGLSDGKNVEVAQGLREGETVLIRRKAYTAPKAAGTASPFEPARPRRNR
jgi:macrolide-specific efflux system membrane fusion protein